MTQSTRDMEQEVEQSRAHLEGTLEALRDKMSFGQVVDEVGRQFRSSGGDEMARNFGRQLRNNPLPLALVGAGLAWLMLSDGRPPRHRVRSSYYGYDYDDEPVFYDEDDVYYPDDGGVGTVYEDATLVADPYADEPRRGLATETPFDEAGPATTSSEGTGPGIGQQARDAGERVGAAGERVYASARAGAEEVRSGARAAGGRAAGAARGASHRVGDAGRSAAGATRDLGDRVGRGARSAYGSARDGLHDAGDRARHAGRRAAEMAERGERQTAELYERDPLLFGALGVAVGAAIGLMLPSTRLENREMGRYRDGLRDDLRQGFRHAVDEGVERAEAAASAGYHAAKSEADAQGLTRKAGEPTLAEKAEKVVEAGVGEATKEAQR